MIMSDGVYTKINELVQASFQLNSFCDNIAYNIDDCNYYNISDVFHHRFAHKFPEFADIITEFMSKIDARAIRGELKSNTENYDGNMVAMFADLEKECEAYRSLIIDVIELAEYSRDFEVKIFLEEFLLSFLPYYKQVRVWKQFAEKYTNDLKSFDVHFKEFTNYIPTV